MIDNENMKEVRFDLYCNQCKYSQLSETEIPCDECLSEPARQYSHKPLKFEEMKLIGR